MRRFTRSVLAAAVGAAVYSVPAVVWGGLVYSGTTSTAALTLRASVPAVDLPPGPDPVTGGGSVVRHDAVAPLQGVSDAVSVESVGQFGSFTAEARGSATVGNACGEWSVGGSGAVSGLANAVIPSFPGGHGALSTATSTFVTDLFVPVDAGVSLTGRLQANCPYHLDRVSTFYVGFKLSGPGGYEYVEFRSGSITSGPQLGIAVDLPLSYTGALTGGTSYRIEAEVTVLQEDVGVGTRPEITGSWEFSLVATPVPEPGAVWFAAGVCIPAAMRRRR